MLYIGFLYGVFDEFLIIWVEGICLKLIELVDLVDPLLLQLLLLTLSLTN